MPMAIPIIAVAAASAASAAIAGATIAGIAASFVISGALAAGSMLLQQKPSSGSNGYAGVSSAFPGTDPGSKVTIRSAATPRSIVYGKARVNGTIIFVHTDENNANLHLVIALADHECEAIDEIYFGDELVSNADGSLVDKWNGVVYFARALGAPGQQANGILMEHAPGLWTATDRLDGVTYLYASLNWNREKFEGGLPDIWAVVRGKKVYDPRGGGTTAYSANAALCTADYIASERHGVGDPYTTAHNLTALAAAANVCDEDVPRAGGGTEKRYTINGAIRTDQKPVDVLGAMLGAMAGRAVFAAGRWNLQAGAWVVPTLSFDENDLRAGFTVQNLLGRRDAFNAVKGTFSNPAKLWQPDDFPSVKPASYTAQDGETVWKDVELPFTSSASAAQRIARIDVRRARQSLSMVWPCKLTGYRAQVGSVVSISNTRLGFVNKPFEVVNVTLVFESSGSGGAQPTMIGVDLKLRETDSSIFDWSTADESNVDAAPNTTLPDPFNVKPPSNLRSAWELYDTRAGGGVKAKWTLYWDPSPDSFVTSGGRYRPQYRRVGATDWTSLPETTAFFAEVFDIDPGNYEARLYAINWAGSPSPPITLPSTYVAGLGAAPGSVQAFTVEANMGFAIARWRLSTELDVLQGGYIQFRHSALTAAATWADGVSISDPQPANAGMAILPLKSGTYLAKYIDSTGNYSDAETPFVQSQSSVLTFSTLGSKVEAPSFSGSKSGAVAVDGLLYLDAEGLFDDVPDVDALVSFDWFGGVQVAGSYSFATKLDLVTSQKVRLTSLIASQVLNVFDDFDSRDGDVDDWPSWDGDMTGNEADARLMVRATQDDPNGSPTWGPWQRLDVADFEARGFEFRLDMASRDASFTIAISTLGVLAEGI